MKTSDTEVTRRSLVNGAGVLGGAGVLIASVPSSSNAADGPSNMKVDKEIAFVRRRIGEAQMTAILDGFIDVNPSLVTGYEAERAAVLREAHRVEAEQFPIPVSAYLVETDGRKVLVDAGSADKLGPKLGRVRKTLSVLGVAPDQIDAVLITHMHPDHLPGIVTPEGTRAFKNAELVVAEEEMNYWSDDGALANAPEATKGFFAGARAIPKVYEQNQTLIAPGESILPSVTSVDLRGHTPGHTGYQIESGGEALMIVGDLVHYATYQFDQPDWGIAFDADRALAASARRRLFDRLASERTLIAGMHLPFPGFGYVERKGGAYRFVPAEWDYF